MNIKQKINNYLNNNATFLKLMYILIVMNVVALVLESYPSIGLKFGYVFKTFEIISVVIFTVEYVLRLWSAEKRLGFIFSSFGMIDLLAILPFYLPLFITFDLRVLRILRLLRILRVFKLGRYSRSLKLISDVLKDTKEELLVTVFVTFLLLILSSTLMYYAEHKVQPEQFASIGHAFWWAIATLTTVGYGDIYPVTALGKFLSAIIALIGIGFVALPTGIISSAFIERIKENKAEDKEKKCPHCGK